MQIRKYTLIILLIIIISPTVAFASWWNPASWGVFGFLHKKVALQSSQNVLEKNYEDKINELQKQIEELRNNQTNSARCGLSGLRPQV